MEYTMGNSIKFVDVWPLLQAHVSSSVGHYLILVHVLRGHIGRNVPIWEIFGALPLNGLGSPRYRA